MTNLPLKNLFEKDIFRDIKGVVKVGQQSEDLRYQEVDEYVVTHELRRHLNKFYNDYGSSIEFPTDKNGVWISGFFGSGKSHFLKILSYLLGNRNITHPTTKDTTSVVKAFNPKINDPIFQADIKKCAGVPTDVILFNIDSKADSDSKNDKEAIVKVFLRVFNESLGYSTKSFQVAEMERFLDDKGKFQDFKNAFQSEYGEPWIDSRDDVDFLADELIVALSKTLDMSPEAAQRWHDGLEKDYKISINDFAKLIRKYLDTKSTKHRIIFMIDEVGQYVGDNRDLMLNLQTVAEDLGTECGPRAWVMVTSQESMERIFSETQSFQSKDFSKIQGRFSTRLSLSSAHADEVIQRRLLEKRPEAREALKALWGTYEADLDNLYTFEGGAELKSYKAEEEFVSFYPFVPFQFKLLQRTLETIRKMGDTGRHIAQGERSLLDATQQALISNCDGELTTLVPYYTFFQSIETFLDGRIRRVFERADTNSYLSNLAKQVLRTLFLVKYIDEFKATPDNIATLHIASIEEDKLQLKHDIRDALEQLEAQFLVQHIGETWSFLTDEEQDVNREIKQVHCTERETIQVIGKTIAEDIWNQKKYRYKNEKDFNWGLNVDGSPIGSGQPEIELELITPLNPDHQSMQTESIARARSGERFFWVMGDDDRYIKEAQTFFQTSQYISRKWGQEGTPNLRAILNTRKQENDQRKIRLVELIQEALKDSSVYVNGTLQPVSGDTGAMLNRSLEAVVDIKFRKYNYAGKAIKNAADVGKVLRNGFEAEITNPLQAAEDDFMLFIQQNHRSTVSDLLKHFGAVPYGWAQLNTFMILARLLFQGKLQLVKGNQVVSHRDSGIIDAWMNRRKSQDYTVSVRQSAGADVMKTVRNWVQKFYSRTDWPSDETDFASEIRSQLNQTRSTWKAWSQEMESNQYPSYKRLKATLAELAQLLEQRNDVHLIKALAEKELDSWLDDHNHFGSFLKSQKQHWDKARKTLADYEALGEHLKRVALEDQAQGIRDILGDTDPWRSIPRLPIYEGSLRKYLKDLIEKEKEETVQKIKKVIETWRERVGGVPNQPLKPLEQLLARARTVNDVNGFRLVKMDLPVAEGRVRDAYNRYIREMEEAGAKPEPTPDAETKPDPAPPKKPRKVIKKLRLKQAVPDIQLIETAADRDRFIEALTRFIDQQLTENHIVEL